MSCCRDFEEPSAADPLPPPKNLASFGCSVIVVVVVGLADAQIAGVVSSAFDVGWSKGNNRAAVGE